MKKPGKVAIIGHFGGKENITDGQTVKTKTLYEELRRAIDWDIVIVDTYYKTKNPLKLVWDSIRVLFTVKDIIVLLSGNGMDFYFPKLSFCSKLIHTRVYHDVIGGNLDKFVKLNPKFRHYLNSFKVNWVETKGLKKRLKKCGIKNCVILPNFKRLSITSKEELSYTEGAPFRFCTFSRVMKEKGIEDAIQAIEEINDTYGQNYCTLDIYGLIDENYKSDFKKVLHNSSDAVKYCGIVDYDKSVEVLKNYYALLFPTFWLGEGFPGTIIDAFSSGLPVIATDWISNSEIIKNGKTGLVYPNDICKGLKEAILYLIDNSGSIMTMKENCLKEAEKYKPEPNISIIVETIKKNQNQDT